MKTNNKFIIISSLMVIGAFSRLVPHMPNFAATEGITIFGVAYLTKKYMPFLISLVLMYLTDFIINNTSSRIYFTESEGLIWYSNYMFFNIIALFLIVFITSYLLKKVTVVNVLSSVVISSIVFFLVTNLGAVFSPASLYTKDFSGLMQSYIAGLPFFRNSLMSNLFFTSIIFGCYHLINLFAIKSAERV